MLVSIGMVGDDGRSLYAVNGDMDLTSVYRHPWLRDNVYPHLPKVGNTRTRGICDPLDRTHPDVRPRAQIARMVAAFISSYPAPRLWAWFSDYDHVVLAQLFGTMAHLPPGVPMRTNDVQQEAERLGVLQMPDQLDRQHHALADAYHTRSMRQFLLDYEQSQRVAR